ncbi:MAG: formylglycine-generating enzyme family protein [Gallionella sp.]|jgi:iron(II)-dependent oxidoreductase
MPEVNKQHIPTQAELKRRKRLLSATITTCIALAMVGGGMHVVGLGSLRMNEMRSLATYNLKEESTRIRAAGEDIALHEENEHSKHQFTGYTVAEADALLTKEQWQQLDSTVEIPAGKFLMGTDLMNADAASRPQHTVNVKAYRIDKYLVTNAQYARFIAATGHRIPSDWKDGKIQQGTLLHPVTLVNWFDASAYAKWAGKRLPTEAEWEKAARGADGRRWPWGNEMDPKRLNTYYNVGSATDVTAYANGISPYGVYDMAGNVDEWVADDFLPYEGTDAETEVFKGKIAKVQNDQDRSMKISDMVTVEGNYKVLRGGSWKGDPFSTASYHRDYSWPNYASDFYGFRCASNLAK